MGKAAQYQPAAAHVEPAGVAVAPTAATPAPPWAAAEAAGAAPAHRADVWYLRLLRDFWTPP